MLPWLQETLLGARVRVMTFPAIYLPSAQPQVVFHKRCVVSVMTAQTDRRRIICQETRERGVVGTVTPKAIPLPGGIVDPALRHPLFQVGVASQTDTVRTIYQQGRLSG